MPSLNKLLLRLNQTGLAVKNTALYEVLKELISGIESPPVVAGNVVVLNINTLTAAVSIELYQVITAQNIFYVFKDYRGNAAANNITLVGTVDGVADPVISTDYGLLRIYGTANGYMTW